MYPKNAITVSDLGSGSQPIFQPLAGSYTILRVSIDIPPDASGKESWYKVECLLPDSFVWVPLTSVFSSAPLSAGGGSVISDHGTYEGVMTCDEMRVTDVVSAGQSYTFSYTYVPAEWGNQGVPDASFYSIMLFPQFVIIGILAIILMFKIIQWPSAWKGTQNDVI